jgi:hypothetical protein
VDGRGTVGHDVRLWRRPGHSIVGPWYWVHFVGNPVAVEMLIAEQFAVSRFDDFGLGAMVHRWACISLSRRAQQASRTRAGVWDLHLMLCSTLSMRERTSVEPT